jgi:hypothetical protein
MTKPWKSDVQRTTGTANTYHDAQWIQLAPLMAMFLWWYQYRSIILGLFAAPVRRLENEILQFVRPCAGDNAASLNGLSQNLTSEH